MAEREKIDGGGSRRRRGSLVCIGGGGTGRVDSGTVTGCDGRGRGRCLRGGHAI